MALSTEQMLKIQADVQSGRKPSVRGPSVAAYYKTQKRFQKRVAARGGIISQPHEIAGVYAKDHPKAAFYRKCWADEDRKKPMTNAEDSSGDWRTINGAHVRIENGKIVEGPESLVGRHESGRGAMPAQVSAILEENSGKLSRTRSGKSDTSSSKDKQPLKLSGDRLAAKSVANEGNVHKYLASLEGAPDPGSPADVKAMLFKIADLTNDGLLPDGSGRFRKWDVSNAGVSKTAPKDIPKGVDDFCRQVYSRWSEVKKDPIPLAAFAEWELNGGKLHPFYDGCGRISRNFSAAVLSRGGKPPPSYDTSEAYLKAGNTGPKAFEGYMRSAVAKSVKRVADNDVNVEKAPLFTANNEGQQRIMALFNSRDPEAAEKSDVRRVQQGDDPNVVTRERTAREREGSDPNDPDNDNKLRDDRTDDVEQSVLKGSVKRLPKAPKDQTEVDTKVGVEEESIRQQIKDKDRQGRHRPKTGEMPGPVPSYPTQRGVTGGTHSSDVAAINSRKKQK